MGYASQLKLFKVLVGGKPVYFQGKPFAKRERDKIKGAVVMRGPDHWRGESFNKSTQQVGKRSFIE